MSIRLEEGDFRGAIRLVSLDSTISENSLSTFQALSDKHPPRTIDYSLPDPPQAPSSDSFPAVSNWEVFHAIKPFPLGSAGGPDGLRPQHLKDIMSARPADPSVSPFLSALASFVSLVLEGRFPRSVLSLLFWSEADRL